RRSEVELLDARRLDARQVGEPEPRRENPADRVALVGARAFALASPAPEAPRRRRAGGHALAVASATAASPAPPPPPASTAAPLTGFAAVDLSSLDVAPVQLGDRPFRLLGRAHLDEPESPRPTRGAIGHDRSGLAASRLREQRFEIRARGRERQVPDEQLL